MCIYLYACLELQCLLLGLEKYMYISSEQHVVLCTLYIDIAWQAGKNATAGEEKSSTLRHESTSKQIFSYNENKNMTVEHFKYLKTHLYLTDQKCLSLKYVK